MAAIIISAILGAIMSTSSGQLLVTASAISTDFYQALLRKNASQKELVLVSRIAVILVSACSLALAYNPNNYILDLGRVRRFLRPADAVQPVLETHHA